MGDSFSWRNRGVRWSVLSLLALTVVSLLVGFVWLPSVHDDFTSRGLWDTICRAAGVPSNWGEQRGEQQAEQRGEQQGSAKQETARPSTRVVLAHAMAGRGASDAVGRGATLAIQQCSMCHGAQGMSVANAPNLAGQYPEVVIKQMHDYKRGDRRSSIMQALAEGLSDRDIVDIAAYYDSLPKARTAPARYNETSAPALVRVGDPMRNIAPCISCHGGIDHKFGTPWLEGMPKEYLLVQLRDFKSGARRNDSHGQMRNMARLMSDAEIEQVVEFYARREAKE